MFIVNDRGFMKKISLFMLLFVMVNVNAAEENSWVLKPTNEPCDDTSWRSIESYVQSSSVFNGTVRSELARIKDMAERNAEDSRLENQDVIDKAIIAADQAIRTNTTNIENYADRFRAHKLLHYYISKFHENLLWKESEWKGYVYKMYTEYRCDTDMQRKKAGSKCYYWYAREKENYGANRLKSLALIYKFHELSSNGDVESMFKTICDSMEKEHKVAKSIIEKYKEVSPVIVSYGSTTIHHRVPQLIFKKSPINAESPVNAEDVD